MGGLMAWLRLRTCVVLIKLVMWLEPGLLAEVSLEASAIILSTHRSGGAS